MIKMKKFNEIFNIRSLRFGSYSAVLTVIVIAAAIILNAIAGGTQLREKLKIDLTSSKLYSIGEKTDNVLKELDKKVEIIGLFDDTQMSSSQYGQVMEFIKQYRAKSNLISISYVDPEKNPGYIQNQLDPDGILGISKSDFIVKSGNRIKVLSSYDIFEYTYDQQNYSGYYITGLNAEYAFTGAIRYVTADNIPVVYYTEGHSEGDIDSEYTELKSSMELNGYELRKINLTAVETIPEDAAIILTISPKQDLAANELEKLTVYMKNGGNSIFLFDPVQSNTRLANFESLLSQYNVALGYDVVFEMAENRAAYGQPYYFMPTVVNNSVNTNLDPSKFNMQLFNVRSVRILKNEKDWINPVSLLTTSSQALGKPLTEGEEDVQGPLDLAVAIEHSGNMQISKMLVVGNANFVSDQSVDTTDSGKKFLLNGINWMQEKKDDIYIPVKTYDVPTIQTITGQTIVILGIVLIVVLPLIIIGIGVFVWLRRRHL